MVGESCKSKKPATPRQGHGCSALHLPDVQQGATVFQVEGWRFLLLFGFFLILCFLLVLLPFHWLFVHHKDKGFRRFPAVFFRDVMADLDLDLPTRI